MRVMVTGATTPLGRAVVDTLTASTDCSGVLAVGREPASGWPAGVHYRRVDLTHRRELDELMGDHAVAEAIDTVVHLAQHRRAADRGPAVHALNVAATRALLLRCLDHSTIQRFVHRSFADVYRIEGGAARLLDEDAALDFDPQAPPWQRDRVEADLTVCSYFGRRLRVAVLRCAELLAPHSGSPLWDYLSSRVCLRPRGFDPLLNLLSLDDAAAAIVAAARAPETGVFNIPGADTLPLSAAITAAGHLDVPMPAAALAPLYDLRRRVTRFEFRYDALYDRRLRLGGIVDGTRARRVLHYEPRHPVHWPSPWWQQLVTRLAALRADERG